MAAVGAEVAGSGFLSPGVISFFILLLVLSIFLTALCSECKRRSFELRECEDKQPSALIRVVKLEDAMMARENPMINEIQKDEKANTVTFTPWRSHLEAPHNHQDVQTNGGAAAMKTTAYETAGDLNSSTPPDSDHIYHTIGGGCGGGGDNADVPLPPTNPDSGEECSGDRSAAAVDLGNENSEYARISKKVRVATPPDHVIEAVQEEEEEEEEFSPPLPDRETQLEG